MASGKMTGVHIGLIICAMLMLIFGVTAFMMNKSYQEQSVDLAKAKDQYGTADTQRKNYLSEITALKATLGASLEITGLANDQDPNTVIGFTNTKMQEYAGNYAQPTVIDTLLRLREELNSKDRTIADLNTSNSELNEEKQGLESVFTAKEKVHDDARKGSERDKTNLIAEKDETVTSITKQLTAEQQKNIQLQIEFEKLQEELNAAIDDRENQISKLLQTNEVLAAELNDLRDESFDIPDGHIVSVHFDTGEVYLNLGHQQNLKSGISFSVYNKDLSNVGGRTSDIKASIRVTKILGDNLSLARISSEGQYPGDFSRPIAKGDAVFSPLWRAGIQETFALAGLFDVDQDKRDDRGILITSIQNAGGVVGDQVLPSGERTGKEITSEYKFLVLGDLGDPALEADEQERAKIQRVHSLTNDMKKEAQQSGVRVITMNDFLSYMGYTPQRRLWRPGENIPWVMTTRRDAGRSREDNVSRGTTSGAYSRSNRGVESPR